MLSIGKLAAGQAKYYLEQAEVRVDSVGSVEGGLEEYYAGGLEAHGAWIGRGAARLGLEGAVHGDALRSVLAGVGRDGQALRASASPVRVAGFDLTFSAPKSVSVIFGVGDADAQRAVRDAHDRAVVESLGYLERSAAAVRRGAGGLVVEPAEGLVAAAFRHRTSRAGDPQLHTHVLVANLGMGSDGRWSALDGRRLYAHARTASFVYQAVLRSELTRALGVEWTPVRKGIAEVVGVRRVVLAAFSRRRADIEAALEERGSSGARAAEAAALATRRPKDRTATADELIGEWRQRAAELGLGGGELARILCPDCAVARETADWNALFQQLARPHGLTLRTATFDRGDVIQHICERVPAAVGLDSRCLEAAADRFLASERAVPLVGEGTDGEPGEAFRRRDGRIVPVARDRLRYSTPDQLAMEQRLLDRVLDAGRQGAGIVDERSLARALAARPTLSDEQRSVVEALCRTGDGVAVVAGRPGTGKTYTLGGAREAWQAAGYPVLGVATARRAAAELQNGAGIQSTSTFALLTDLRSRDARLPERCVLVVDEAAMVATRDIAQLVDAVLAVEGKLVLVGDDRQLPELEAGGTFRALVRRGLGLELRANVRQVHAWERRALDELRDGAPELALAEYVRRERIVVEDTSDAARERLVADWLRTEDTCDAVMIARRRADVTDLNALARKHLREAGALGPDVETPAGEFAVGDAVVIKRNDRRLGVNNGDRAQVVAVGSGALIVRCRADSITLDRRFLAEPTVAGDPPLVHGYAITGHVAQGLTVDHALVLADGGIDREWAYVALSRGGESNRIYLAAQPDDERAEFAPAEETSADPLQRLVAQLHTSRAQVLAIDSGRPLDEAPATRGRFGWMRSRLRAATTSSEAEVDVRRGQFEAEHGARPFATRQDFDQHVGRLHERQVDRLHERVLQRVRGIGREL